MHVRMYMFVIILDFQGDIALTQGLTIFYLWSQGMCCRLNLISGENDFNLG